MKKNKFSETQILETLKKQEAGVKVSDICREIGISEPTFYNWKAKFSGMTASDIKRLKELEEELAKFKLMYANLSLDHQILKDVVSKKW
jgi:putative transposase